jgi:hypothetical protein
MDTPIPHFNINEWQQCSPAQVEAKRYQYTKVYQRRVDGGQEACITFRRSPKYGDSWGINAAALRDAAQAMIPVYVYLLERDDTEVRGFRATDLYARLKDVPTQGVDAPFWWVNKHGEPNGGDGAQEYPPVPY